MYLVRTEVTVLPGRIREFEAFNGRVFDLLSHQPGFLRGGLANALGNPNRYTSLAVWEHRDAAAAGRRSEGFQSFLAASNLPALVTPTRPQEAYEVVSRVADQDLSTAGFVVLLDMTVEIAQTAAFEERSKELLDLRRKFGHGLVSNTIGRYLGSPGRYLGYYVHTDQEAATRTRLGPEVQRFNETRPLTEVGATITSIDLNTVILTKVPTLAR